MKRTFLLLTVFLTALLLISCEKDFDLNADWKDITIVYGILDQNETEHYVKINRAFTTGPGGNANQIAMIPDSLYYDTTALDVVITEWENGSKKNTYQLIPVVLHNKEPGAFFSDWQILYKFNANLNHDRLYRLEINNTKRNKLISSETNLVHDFTIDKPRAGSKASFTSVNPVDVEWYSADNGRRYQLTIRFHYKEKSFDSDTIERYADWVFSPVNSLDTEGGEEMEMQYTGQGFYDNLQATVPYDDPAKEGNIDARIYGNVDFILTVANDELNIYLDVNEPSSSIIEDRPSYTNIDNGIGIFCSRFKKVRTLPLAAPSAEKLRQMSLHFE